MDAVERDKLRQHIESRVQFEPNTGCWLWEGSFSVAGDLAKTMRARVWALPGESHGGRVAYRAFHGDIPPGLIVRHKCDTPLCLNPNHLELGTPKDNAMDREMRGRHPKTIATKGRPCPARKGEKNGRAKISDVDKGVIERSDERNVVLAERYGISPSRVKQIKGAWRRGQLHK